MEQWKKINGFDGMYEVSNYGRVRTDITVQRLLLRKGYTKDGNIYRACGTKLHIGSFYTKEDARECYEKYIINLNLGYKFLKLKKEKNGYLTVHLRYTKKNVNKHKKVHRLVAEYFIDNPENKPQVNHKDGNKLNNNDWNLEWSTAKENTQHAHDNGLAKINNKKLVKCIDNGMIFESITKAGEWLNDYKFSNTKKKSTINLKISKNCHEKTKIAYGFRWKFIN